MSQKTLLLIGILVLVTLGLVYAAVSSQNSKSPTNNTTSDTNTVSPSKSSGTMEQSGPKVSTIYFDPETTRANSATVMIDSGIQKITGVQLEMNFDPNALSNITFTIPSDSILGKEGNYTVLYDKVDYQKGKATYAAGISLSTPSFPGTGKVVTVSYTIKPGANLPTKLSFVNKRTLVTQSNITTSVLKDTRNLTIEK